jgi:predicted porin
LSAQFLIEQGINLTNGQLFSSRAAAAGQQYDGIGLAPGNNPPGAYSTSTNRQAFVGLKGGWGEVLAGYQYTTLYRISTLSGFFVGSEQPGGDLAHGTLDNANYGGTRANGITYNSPKFSNFQLTVQRGATSGREDITFQAGANTANGRMRDDANRWSAMLNYQSGPLNVTIGHTRLTTDISTVAASASCPVNIFGACTATTTAAVTTATDSSARLTQIGASYQAGAFKIVGSWAKGSRDNNAPGVTLAASRSESKAYQGGLEYAAGAFRPFITLGRGHTENGAGVETGDFKLTQFGLRYDLSKRTTAYIMHGTTKDTAAPIGTTSPSTLTGKRQMTGAGMMMTF